MNIKPNCINFNVVSQLYPDKRYISYNIRISPASDIFLSSINFKTTAFDVMYLEIRNQFFLDSSLQSFQENQGLPVK